jgi:hypothetical protein
MPWIPCLCSLDGLLQSILSTFPQHSRRSTYPRVPSFKGSVSVLQASSNVNSDVSCVSSWLLDKSGTLARSFPGAKHRFTGSPEVGFSQLWIHGKPRISEIRSTENVEMTRTCELFRPKRSRTTIHRKLNSFRSNQKKLSSSMSR